MTETPDGQAESGAWLTLADAARFHRVTVRTLDRRKLPKRRRPGRPVEVWIAGATSDDVRDVTETPPDAGPTIEERALAVSDSVSDMIRQHTAPLYARIEDLAREAGTLAAELQAERERAEADRQRLGRETDALDETARLLAQQVVQAEAERDDARRQLAARRWWWRWWPC